MSLTTLSYPANEITVLGHSLQEQKVPGWETIKIRRQAEINNRIPKTFLLPPALIEKRNRSTLVDTCGLFSPRELDILHQTATSLLECIHNQTYTSVEVATAFCKSAAVAHQAVGLLRYLIKTFTK